MWIELIYLMYYKQPYHLIGKYRAVCMAALMHILVMMVVQLLLYSQMHLWIETWSRTRRECVHIPGIARTLLCLLAACCRCIVLNVIEEREATNTEGNRGHEEQSTWKIRMSTALGHGLIDTMLVRATSTNAFTVHPP